MGMMPPPEKCHITGLELENYPSSFDLVEYVVLIKGKKVLFRFHWDYKNSPFIDGNRHILYGLILNGLFPINYGGVDSPVLDNQKLEQIIHGSVYPKSPEDKINHLLIYLHSLQDFEGSNISFPEKVEPDDLAKSLFFKNYKEMAFYLFTLKSMGLIKGRDSTTRLGAGMIGINLTFDGLSKVMEIRDSGNQSNRCFVAMSFSPDQNETRDSIKNAILETGFDPILIDEQHIDSDVTINDALISEIRKSKFVIADFSQHKHGVYFEAGFALGLKKPVIYTCKKEDFDKTHFDTNHYPHIIYESQAELKQKVKDKIEAWIK